jgi:eukaryotic-like serine/threonine-protein kinase
MSPERWKLTERIFHDALELDPNRREAFLCETCGTDEELRREVELLIAAHLEVRNLDIKPAFDAVAKAIAERKNIINPGHMLGLYKILAPLGAGGMSEVYLAHDSRLERKVAIKILPAFLAMDEEKLRRFKQEARAASALNHPNILTVHEVGQTDGANYIVTEFIDGETLRQRMKSGEISLTTALDVAMQVAGALNAAHEAGIAHRDIKPENIMLRHDGYVKVLDFGIAKLIGEKQLPPQVEHPTAEHFKTDTGTVMGTAPYMSPEQARGEKDIDTRTDLFSLGVVLYEMVAGQSPFARPTFAETLGAILHLEPSPLASHRSGIPPALEGIVSRAICKDRVERYQTAKALSADLDWLKREIVNAPHPEQIAFPDHESVAVVSKARAAIRRSGVGQTRWLKTGAVIALTFGLAALAVAVFLIHQSLAPRRPSFQAEIRKLTDSGKVTRAAISPDGNYFAYTEETAGKQGLLVRQVNGTVRHPIVEPDEVTYTGLSFSPDGEFVYYVRQRLNENAGTLYRVRMLGGSSEKLTEGVDTPITFAPDGRYAFGREDYTLGRSLMVVAKADGSDEKTLATHKLSDHVCSLGIAWSPDGKIIVCSSLTDIAGEDLLSLIAVRVSNAAESRISSPPWRRIDGISWLGDGSGLLVVADEKGALFSQIFCLSYPSGEVRKITYDLNGHSGISLAANSRKLVTIKNARFSNIWLIPANGDVKQARRVTSGSEAYYDLSWTPDGNILTSWIANDNLDLWVMDTEGKNRRQLTFGPFLNFRGQFSPDGRYIIYLSNQRDSYNIWRADADGKNKVQLTSGPGEFTPRISPDGRWVFYISEVSGQRSVWKVSIEGGTPFRLTSKPSMNPVVSPNGTLIACYYLDDQKSSKWQVAIIPVSGGNPIKIFEPPLGLIRCELRGGVIRWLPDGKALAYSYTCDGVSNLWIQPLDGGKPKRLTEFGAEQITFFDWSRDGRQLALLRVSEMNDVALLVD